MAHTVNVNFKLDEDVKKRMERACAEMGLSMSAAFTMFAKKVGREYRIPFEVSADPFYSESNLRLMKLLWEDRAWSDYLYWQTQDKKTLKRINALIKDIQRSPYQGIGKPEPLRGNLSGWWSRRIDETNRIVYYEQGEVIYIISCLGHYDD